MEKNKQAFHQNHAAIVVLSLIMVGVFAISAQSQGPTASGKTKKASQFNSQVFEKDEEQQSFKSQVKLVRDMAGETQVFLTERPGFFRLDENASFRNLLIKAQKSKQSLTITVDLSNRSILQVKDSE